MSPKGIQITLSDIRGGMFSDLNPVRLPSNAFQEIINAEYTRLGKLVKSQGYSVLPLVASGEVRDIKGVYDVQGSLIGYLIAQDRLRYVDDLGIPTVDNMYGECVSKIVPSPNGYYYYISGSTNLGKLMRWRMLSGTISNFNGKVPTPGSGNIPVYETRDNVNNPFRVNSQDLSNNDSTLTINWNTVSSATLYYRPTSWVHYSSGGFNESHFYNPENAVDGDLTTAATLFNGCLVIYPNSSLTVIYSAFQDIVSTDNVTLKVLGLKVQAGLINLYYSVDGGSIWTEFPNPTNPWDGTEQVTLTGPVDLGLVKVKIVLQSWLGSIAEYRIYDIVIEAIETSANSRIIIRGGSNHPGVIGPEKFNRVVVPIKTNNLTTSRNVVFILDELDARSDTVLRTESLNLAISNTAEEIDTTTQLANDWYVWDDGTKYTRITIRVSTPGGSNESLVFYRAKRWHTLRNGLVTVVTPAGSTEYADREPLMATALINTLNNDTYAYALSVINDLGETGGLSPSLTLALTVNSVVYADLAALIAIFEALEFEDSLESININKTLVGGTGSFYNHLSLKSTDFDALNLLDTTTGVWNMTTPLILPPKIITDNRDVPRGVIVDSENKAADFNVVDDSLIYFRNRLWVISHEADASGVVRRFIRYSEIDSHNLFPASYELSIPDYITTVQPLREDLMLGFSPTKTYLITPLGDGFDYLKIADVGCDERMAIAAYDLILWLNQYGIYVYDGSVVTLVKQSTALLSWIKKFHTHHAIASVIVRDQKIMWTATFDGSNWGLIYDLTNKAVTLRRFNQPLTKFIEIDDDLVGPMYAVFFGGPLGQYGGYTEGTEVIETTIKSRRFQTMDASLIRLYYFGFVFNAEAQGEATITFTFALGTQVVKTINLSDAQKVGEQKVSKIQIYGNDEWFEFEISHNSDAPFEIREFYLGIAPTVINFPERSPNAQEMA